MKAKKFEKFKKNLLEPSVSKKTDNISNVDIPDVSNKPVQSTSNKPKPIVSPRTIIFKNSDEGISTFNLYDFQHKEIITQFFLIFKVLPTTPQIFSYRMIKSTKMTI